MSALISGGTALSLLGLMGLLFCIRKVQKAKKTARSDGELRQSVKQALPINLGSLFLSALGLMAVVVGILMTP